MTHQTLSLRAPIVRPRLAVGATGTGAVLVTAHVANDALTSMLSALLPSLQARLALSDGTLALLVATLALSASVTQPVMGALSDRFGARSVAAAGTAFGVSVLSLLPVVPNAAVLAGLLLLGGLGSAAFHPAATSLLATVPLRRRELAVGLFSAAGTVGLAIGPLFVLLAAATIGLGSTPWLIVAALVLGGVMLLLPPDAGRRDVPRRARILDTRLVRGPVGTLAIAATLASVAYVTFTSAYPLYLVRVHGVSASDPVIGFVLAAFNLGAAGGAVVAGGLASRVDRRLLTGVPLLASLAPLGLALVVPPGEPVHLVTVAAAGALLNANLPVLLVAAHRLAPGQTAAASGMLMGLPIGVAGLLYVVVGRLQEVAGLVPAMALAFAAVVPAAAVALRGLRGHGERHRSPTAAPVTTRCCDPIGCHA